MPVLEDSWRINIWGKHAYYNKFIKSNFYISLSLENNLTKTVEKLLYENSYLGGQVRNREIYDRFAHREDLAKPRNEDTYN
ncbi:MAG: hypothetical protein QW699_06385 [Metallosphaera sp.]